MKRNCWAGIGTLAIFHFMATGCINVPESLETALNALNNCRTDCAIQSEANYLACTNAGHPDDYCQVNRQSALQGCDYDCETTAPNCANECEARTAGHAAECSEQCVSFGGSEATCRDFAEREQETAFDHCIAVCEEPDVTCEESCQQRALDGYDVCLADGGSDDFCTEYKRDALSACLEKCDLCSQGCVDDALASFEACLESGISEDECTIRKRERLRSCLDNCSQGSCDPFSSDYTCDDRGTEVCEDGRPQVLIMRFTGDDCEASDHSQGDDKFSCSGEVDDSALLFEIRASDEEDFDDDRAHVWFEGRVAIGETFAIDATNGGEDSLKSKSFVHVLDLNGELLQAVEFHTSCSQPLNLGDQFGSILLDGFVAD